MAGKGFRDQLPAPLRERLRALDRRLLPRELDAIIEELCVWRALGLRELGEALHRSPVYLQNTSLKRLLKQGRLQFLHPLEPNHPKQAYTVPKPVADAISPTVEDTLDIGRND